MNSIIDLVKCWEPLAKAAQPVAQKYASRCLTFPSIGIWLDPVKDVFVIQAEKFQSKEANLLRKELRWEKDTEIATFKELETLPPMVKLAYSPTLRAIGENLNFLPGTYFTGHKNHASPLAAAITAGLIGSGLGYGAGKLAEKILPIEEGKLPTTLALAGLGGGVLPSLGYGLLNMDQNYSITEPGIATPLTKDNPLQIATSTVPIPLDKEGSSFGQWVNPQHNISDVNIDALGKTMWAAGTPDGLQQATVGVLYGASRMPGEKPGPVISGRQLANFAMQAGGGYLDGYAAGIILNKLTGIPVTPNQVGIASAVNNTLGGVVRSLFGS